jgi:TPR repeat protein
MTFETEMDQFFIRNCYFEKERERVKAWRPYQLAAQKGDTIEAQEIATRVLEAGLGISKE